MKKNHIGNRVSFWGIMSEHFTSVRLEFEEIKQNEIERCESSYFAKKGYTYLIIFAIMALLAIPMIFFGVRNLDGMRAISIFLIIFGVVITLYAIAFFAMSFNYFIKQVLLNGKLSGWIGLIILILLAICAVVITLLFCIKVI